jgi:MFS family permease
MMLQSSLFDVVAFDPFAFQQNGLASAEVDVGRYQVLHGAATLGPIIVARFADRFGAKPVVAASFLLGALAIMALALKLPLTALLAIVALVGIGTSGTQMLI